ncbi:MAG: hypothetical protein L3K19_07745 [Thermoplasmata archaeon]|nr:hypothetical protein [Thermoplasmata archaeon]
MALFSDIDWVILLGVVGFFLLGQGNGAMLRTIGRYYGRAMRLKADLLAEFTQAAEIPTAPGGKPLTIRQALLGFDEFGQPTPTFPAAVTAAPVLSQAGVPRVLSGQVGPETWSIAVPTIPVEGLGSR